MAGVFGKDRVADLQSLGKGRGRVMERLKKRGWILKISSIYFLPITKIAQGFIALFVLCVAFAVIIMN